MVEREPAPARPIEGVIFDLDGVLVDSEPWWAASRTEVAARHGRAWTAEDESNVKGANSPEWSAAMRERLGLTLADAAIEREVVDLMLHRYREATPIRIESGIRAARRLGTRWPLAVASAAHPAVLRAALASLGLADAFRVVISADDVGRGKPAPDVYLEAARRLGVGAPRCLVVEDSASGVRAAHSAGMRVVWVGTSADVREGRSLGASLVLRSLDELDDGALERLASGDPSPGG